MEQQGNVPSRPWWEPYVFTGGLLVAIAVFFTVCDLFLSVPYVEHLFFAVMAAASLIAAIRRPTKDSSPIANIGLAVFCGLASSLFLSRSQLVLGVGYAGLAVLWLFLFIRALIIQRQLRNERLAKLDHVIEVLRRAKRHDD